MGTSWSDSNQHQDGPYAWQSWDLEYRYPNEGGGSYCPDHMAGFDSAELGPGLQHVMTPSEFGEFKSQVQSVCQKYWYYGKTLPSWFKFIWPRFLWSLFVIGAAIAIYSLTLDVGSNRSTLLTVGLATAFGGPFGLVFVGYLIRMMGSSGKLNDEVVDPQLDEVIKAWNERLSGRGQVEYVKRQWSGSEGGFIEVREIVLRTAPVLGLQTPQQLQITQVPPGVQLQGFAPPPPPPAPPPPQWTQHHDPSTGKPYWANQQGQTTWEDPNTRK